MNQNDPRESHEKNEQGEERPVRCYRGVTPSKAAEEELTWFFNESETWIDSPSNYAAMVAGAFPMTLDEVEQRAEARHAADKIHARLLRVRTADAIVLASLFTEREWPDAVNEALPGGLAGVALESESVGIEYKRAVALGKTRAKGIAAFIEEVVRKGRPDLVADWRYELEVAAAIAVTAYERARGEGPSMVPEEGGA